MPLNLVTLPYQYYPDFTTGRPVYFGSIYVGDPDTDPEFNQKTVTLRHEGGDTAVAQPITTSAGGVPQYNGSPAQILVDGNYSIKVLNQALAQVYYVANAFNGDPITAYSGDYVISHDTVAAMVADSLLEGNTVRTAGLDDIGDGGFRDYLIKTTAQAASNNDIIDEVKFGFTLANGLVAILQLVVNSTDYASYGSNIAGPISIVGHTPGSIVSDSASATIEADKYYRVTLDITTTTEGFVEILFDGSEAIYGDQTSGFWFSTANILNDGTENNQEVSDNLYYFALATSSTAYSTVSVVTDLLWGGTITGLTIEEITPREVANEITPSDGVGRNNNIGIKAGALNRNDLALGDKSTLGAMTETSSPIAAHNVAVGSRSLAINFKGDENTSLGAFALQGNEGSNSTAVGYSALKIASKGQENVGIGYKSGPTLSTGYKNVFAGFWSGVGIRTGVENVDLGWRPNISGAEKSYHTAIGSRAGTAVTGDSNTLVGALAGVSISGQSDVDVTLTVGVGAECKPWGDGAVTVGHQSKAGTEGALADNAVAVGKGANAVSERSVSIGFNASSQSIGAVAIGDAALATTDQSIAIGDGATATGSRSISVGDASTGTGTQNTVIGAAATHTGDFVTALGFRAGVAYTGDNNTFVGHDAGVQAIVAYENCTLLGADTEVTASNQVQLGSATTTTYAYGAVQDRSDARDKIDAKDLTDAQIAFFMAVEWKQFKMNYRESYIEIVDGVRVEHPNDGSNTGTRYHIGAIAQQVESAMLAHDVDFAGLQHHSVSGGQDVYSIGYQEFIGLQGEIIQRQQASINDILARLEVAGI